MKREASTYDAEAGNALERTLLAKWRASLSDSDILTDTLVSQHDVLDLYPREWGMRAPRVYHAECRQLVEYPDAWCRTVADERLVVNAKCTRDYKAEVSPVAWIQMQAELAVTRADAGLVVYGQKWIADYISGPPEERGPIDVFRIDPDARAQAAIVQVVREAWQRVSVLREMEAEQTKGAVAA